MSDALDKPCRSRTEAALDVAIAALKTIAGTSTTRSLLDLVSHAKVEAKRALERIETLRKETSDGD